MKYIIFIFLLCLTPMTFAQNKSDSSIDEIEGLFKEDADEESRLDERSNQAQAKQNDKKEKEKTPEEIEDLKRLETFSNIAVIQKRYLPKTKRFEFYAAGGTNLNDAFFVGNGLNARLGYNFTEKWGIEGMYTYIQNSNRDVTNTLLQKGVTTEGSVSTDSYYGVDIKWTPIYGKYAYFNEKIIPFDLYFSFGVGKTDPRIAASSTGGNISSVTSPYTIKVGTGQIFAITKWMAFRWDMSFHMIQAKTETRDATTNALVSQGNSMNNNLFLNVGLSFFFPEANYR